MFGFYGLKFTLTVMEAVLFQRVQSLPAAATPARGPVMQIVEHPKVCWVFSD